jgi:hypothetical protein
MGSSTCYEGLRLKYGGRNIAHLVERANDPLLERCKSELWEALKEVMPPDGVVEEAARLLIRDVRHFETNYPNLVKAKNVASQLVKNVIRVLVLRYPSLRKCNAATPVLEVREMSEQQEDRIKSLRARRV